MSSKITRYMYMLAMFTVTIISMANLYAAEAETDSEYYLRDEEFNLKKVLRHESANGAYSLRLGGRLLADTAWFINDGNNALNNNTWDAEFRRARLFVSGKVLEDWRYRFEYDFASGMDFRIKSAWVGYSGFNKTSFRAGNMLEPFSLENMTSSNNITFMERALPYAFGPNYKLGALMNTYGDNWSAATGFFGGNAVNGGKDGWAVVARVTGVPVRSEQGLIHIGAALEYREPDEVRYSSRPEAHLATPLVSTGTLKDIDNTVTTGLEAAAVYGSLSLQGEYMLVNVKRTNQRADPGFYGWYVFGSWFVTGEHRRYNGNKGTFKQVRPTSKYGAWELAARYSAINLEDKNVTGGDENNITLGVNWYLNRAIRFMANYVRTDANPDRNGGTESPDIFQLRAQLVF